MDSGTMLNAGSLLAGFISAGFWIKAALVKVPPPEIFKGKPDDMYMGHIIVGGADLIPTMRAQAKWNSAAAVAAAVTVLLQIAANLLAV